jgi:hypothetical protein
MQTEKYPGASAPPGPNPMQPLINQMVAQNCKLDTVIDSLIAIANALKKGIGGGGNPNPPVDINIGQVNVNPDAVSTVRGPNSNRYAITVQNVGPDPVWIGTIQNLTPDVAMLLENGADITFEMFSGSIYAMTEGANDKAHLHFLEAVLL